MDLFGVKDESLVKELIYTIVDEVALKKAEKRYTSFIKKTGKERRPGLYDDPFVKFFEEERIEVWNSLIQHLFEDFL